jgi:hypothetical protein
LFLGVQEEGRVFGEGKRSYYISCVTPINVQGCDKLGFIEGFLKPVTCNSVNICHELLWLENEQYQSGIVFP